MVFRYSPFPTSIQGLTAALVSTAARIGFHGPLRVTVEGNRSSPTFVLTMKVKELRQSDVVEAIMGNVGNRAADGSRDETDRDRKRTNRR